MAAVQPTLLGLLQQPGASTFPGAPGPQPRKAAPRRKRENPLVVPKAPALTSDYRERRYAEEIHDVEDTCWSLTREFMNPLVVARFNIIGEPVSKGRARYVRAGGRVKAYTPKKTRDSEHEVAWHFRQARPDWIVDPASGFGVFAVFFAQTFQRRDVDNMLKLVLDGLNSVVWADDSQVTEISGRLLRGGQGFSGEARTAVLIYRTMAISVPTGRCQTCGTDFVLHKSQAARKYCSRACSTQARTGKPSGQKKIHNCARCGGEFTIGRTQNHDRKYCSEACQRQGGTTDLTCVQCGNGFKQWTSWKPSGAALCSKECGVAFWRSNGTKTAKGRCSECGGPVSRREYKRCRSCVRAVTPTRTRGPATGVAS